MQLLAYVTWKRVVVLDLWIEVRMPAPDKPPIG